MRFVLTLAGLFVGSLSAQSAVLVVDWRHPAGTFATLEEAVSAAADGDIVLVRSGRYGEVILDSKGVTIVKEAAGTPTIQRVVVRNLPAQSFVTVRGFLFEETGKSPEETMVELDSCAGAVWFEDCSINAGFQFSRVSDCASVVFDDCELVLWGGPQGMELTRSRVFLFDSFAFGQTSVSTMFPSDGLPAIRIEDGLLWLGGSEVWGGSGGFADFGCNAADGAPAILLRGTAPQVFVADTRVFGGPGGSASLPGCPDGQSAPPFDAPVGIVRTVTTPTRRLECPVLARAGETVTLTWRGVPGDRVYLRYALAPSPGTFPRNVVGPLLLAQPVTSLVGFVGASGVLQQDILVPPLEPPGTGLDLFLQGMSHGWFKPAFQWRVPSTPSHIVLLF